VIDANIIEFNKQNTEKPFSIIGLIDKTQPPTVCDYHL